MAPSGRDAETASARDIAADDASARTRTDAPDPDPDVDSQIEDAATGGGPSAQVSVRSSRSAATESAVASVQSSPATATATFLVPVAAPTIPAAPPPNPTLLTVLFGFFRDVQRTFFNRAPDARNQHVTVALVNPSDVSDPFALAATDRDGDALAFSLLGNRGPKHGTVTFDQATGTFTYNPDDAFARLGGTDKFTYKVSDQGSGLHLADLWSVLTHPDFGHADFATVTVTVAPTPPKSGIDLSQIDENVRPQDDFFGWLHGRWLTDHEIPADRPIDNAFRLVQDRVNQQLRELIAGLTESASAPGTDAQRIGDLYASYLDVDTIANVGLQPLLTELARIDGAADADALAAVMGALARTGVYGGFSASVDVDAKDPSRNLLHLNQSGLGLPDESYYREPQYADIRAAYQEHIAKMFALVYGGSPSDHAEAAQRIVALETTLASAHWDVVKDRDAELTYNLRTLDELRAQAPGFDWDGWLGAFGVTAAQAAEVVVRQPDYLTAFAQDWGEGSLQDWKDWARWQTIHVRAYVLTDDVLAETFDFFGKKLTGSTQPRPRWEASLAGVRNLIGDALGKVYVEQYFPAEAKQRIEDLVENLIEAYRVSISGLDWMTAETRAKALEKLDKLSVKIGYPEEWADYSGLQIARDDLYGNLQRATEVNVARMIAKLGHPVDRGEWFVAPFTVNAYYDPTANEIVFPAAILQAPFFDPDVDDAVNYGGIGAVIGHEIGHAFDDQGSKYDGDGNLADWWTEADRAAFAARTAVLEEQYSQYTPRQLPDGPNLNGALTVGENIADLGGLAIAPNAYQMSLNGKAAPVIDGYTGVQRVFLGYAQTSRSKARDAYLIEQIATDPHSPEEFRVNGVVRNIDAFYEAFGVDDSDALYLPPEQRVRIWY